MFGSKKNFVNEQLHFFNIEMYSIKFKHYQIRITITKTPVTYKVVVPVVCCNLFSPKKIQVILKEFKLYT